MNVSESQLAGLPIDEQLFTVVNDERIDRGLPPIDYMTSQLNCYAQAGPTAARDPSFPSSVTGGAPITYGGSVWAGGLTVRARGRLLLDVRRRLERLVDDQRRLQTCWRSRSCWGHRDIILHEFPQLPDRRRPCCRWARPIRRAATPAVPWPAIIVSSCAPPSDITLTWGQVASAVQSSSTTIGIAPLPNGTGYWEAESNGTVAAFGVGARTSAR